MPKLSDEHPLTMQDLESCNRCIRQLEKAAAVIDAWEKSGARVDEFREQLSAVVARLQGIKRAFFPEFP